MARPSENYGPTDDPDHDVDAGEYFIFSRALTGGGRTGGGIVNTSNSYSPAGLKVTANGSNLLTVAAGQAQNIGVYYTNSTSFTVPVVANTSGTDRIDALFLTLQKNVTTGLLEQTVTYAKGGTIAPDEFSGGGPALRAQLGVLWDQRLANFTVKGHSTVVQAADVIDTRYGMGAQSIVMNTGQLVSPKSQIGQLQFRAPNRIYQAAIGGGWEQIYPLPDPTFIRVSFASGLRDYNAGQGGGYANVAYALFPDGTVQLRGLIECSGGTVGNGSRAFTLPVGYRPTSGRVFCCWSKNDNDDVLGFREQAQRVTIQADGKVILFNGLKSGGFLSFDGINFWANA